MNTVPLRPLVVLNPEGVRADALQAEKPSLAPRLSSLDGKTIGLVDDGFAGSEEFVRGLGDLLASAHADVTIRYWHKPVLSRPAPLALIEEVAAACDAVVVGVAA